MRLNIGKTLVIGLAFFTISLAWTIYNNYVPVFLSELISSSALVGAIMTVDNLFGILLQPYFGRLSDNTKTKFGRRMPFIIFGVPAAALFFMLIPTYSAIGGILPGGKLLLPVLMIFVIGMNLAMSVYRAPAVAMMPDATPPALRSRANGIINAMGGLGSIIAFLVGGMLFKESPYFPFIMGGMVMLLALGVLLFFHKEPEEPYSAADDEGGTGVDTGLFIGKKGAKPLFVTNKSLIFLLITVFFWFCGFECINSFFTLFCQERFGTHPGDSTKLLAPMALSFMASAYPGGLLGAKIGRRRAMLLGNGIIVLAFICVFFINSPELLGVILAVSGIGWAFINANAYPTITQMAPQGQTGRYTGYYYAFTFAASIISPIAYGLVSDLAGTRSLLFVFGGVMFVLGLIFLMLTRQSKKMA